MRRTRQRAPPRPVRHAREIPLAGGVSHVEPRCSVRRLARRARSGHGGLVRRVPGGSALCGARDALECRGRQPAPGRDRGRGCRGRRPDAAVRCRRGAARRRPVHRPRSHGRPRWRASRAHPRAVRVRRAPRSAVGTGWCRPDLATRARRRGRPRAGGPGGFIAGRRGRRVHHGRRRRPAGTDPGHRLRPGPGIRRGHGRRRAAPSVHRRAPGPLLGPARRQGSAGRGHRGGVRPAADPGDLRRGAVLRRESCGRPARALGGLVGHPAARGDHVDRAHAAAVDAGRARAAGGSPHRRRAVRLDR